jgi:predicted CXXCH cytochrome family protein
LKSQKKWTFTCVTLLGIFFLVSATGCDKHTRYKVLTFFFTGIPSVEGTVAAERVTGTSPGEKKRKKPETAVAFVHGPYASKQCDLCHVIEAEKPQKAGEYAGGFPRLQDLPSKLLLPINELCIDCHVAKAYTSAYREELWIHGPVSSGICTVCHHHHVSRADYMLLAEKPIDLCSQCHTGDFITNIAEHTEGKDCLECHNAHVGKDRFLLKKDYVEIY